MRPDRAAFLAGQAWLTDGPRRPPDANDLASLVDPETYGIDGLAFAFACVPVAAAVSTVLAARDAMRSCGVPRWVALAKKLDWEEEARRVQQSPAE